MEPNKHQNGLQTAISRKAYPFNNTQSRRRYAESLSLLYQEMQSDHGIHEKTIAIAGQRVNIVYALISALQALLPKVHFIGQFSGSVLNRTRLTKTPDEVERIRQMGQVTTSVVGKVADLLSSSPVNHNVLMAADGNPLTIGMVKSNIRRWLAEAGADNPEETIFAIAGCGCPYTAPPTVVWNRQNDRLRHLPAKRWRYFNDFTRTCVCDMLRRRTTNLPAGLFNSSEVSQASN
jgi:Xaa-Pro aminopeptidase